MFTGSTTLLNDDAQTPVISYSVSTNDMLVREPRALSVGRLVQRAPRVLCARSAWQCPPTAPTPTLCSGEACGHRPPHNAVLRLACVTSACWERRTKYSGNPVISVKSGAMPGRDPTTGWWSPKRSAWLMAYGTTSGADVYTSPDFLKWSSVGLLNPVGCS